MLLDIGHALKSPGVSFGFAVSESLAPMCAGGEEISFSRPVEVRGTLTSTGELIMLKGTLSAGYTARCSRCLADVHECLSVEFTEEFARAADEDHPDRYLYSGEKLDLGQMAGDLISLNTPMRHLCAEDCRGLCPACGADRNHQDCGCVPAR